MSELSRVPPAAVRRALREEVGFCCPVDGCESPYLEWHHFDPPWRERHHHDPQGMVALCRSHHPEADAGAFTLEQLREFKRTGARGVVGAKINWMRQDLLTVVGGVCYYGVKTAVQIKNTPVVWFGRDEAGNLLVNVNQLTASNQPRMQMRDNFWLTEGLGAQDIECLPSGRSVKAAYENGDRISIAFQQHQTWDEFERRLDLSRPSAWPQWIADVMRADGLDVPPTLLESMPMPFTTVVISMKIAETDIEFSGKSSKIHGTTIGGGWVIGPGLSGKAESVGLQIG